MNERPKHKTGSHQNPRGASRQNLFDLGHSNFLLNTSLEARETKAKMNYWDLIKIKIFCTVKETIEWEKVFSNDILNKLLVSKISIEVTKLNTHKTNT